MMRTNWNYYSVKGKAEGIKTLNHTIVGYGDEDDMKELIGEQRISNKFMKYSYEVKECKSKPGQLCLHMKRYEFWR